MMSEMQSYEMQGLRKELRIAAERIVEQEVEIMLLEQRVKRLRAVIDAKDQQMD